MKKVPVIELFLCMISYWWAFVCFTNEHLFDRIPELFKVFERISQEYGWGLVFVASATIKILGILLEKNWLRKIGLMLSMFLYGLISAGFILSKEPLSTGTGTYFAISVLSLWALREVRERDA